MEITFWDVALLLIFIVTLFLLKSAWDMKAFQRKGVKALPAYPMVGNIMKTMTGKEHFMSTIDTAYHAFSDEKYFGFYHFNKQMIVAKDIEMIKLITVKDFDHFQDHVNIVSEDMDPLFGKNLLSLKGRRWRDMRATLSPAFTSSKMRNMFSYVAECGEVMSKFYLNKIKDTADPNADTMELEIKEAFTRYTNDVIATSAFGVKIDSLNEPDNEFYQMGKMATTFTFWQLMKSLGLLFTPKLMKMLKVSLFSSKLTNFFRKLVVGQLRDREENNIIRPDMIHLLMEARKGFLTHDAIEPSDAGFAAVEESDLGKLTIKNELEDDDIVAQALLFFIAGFDTSSTLLTFMAIELSIETDVQKKLQAEIDELSAKCNGKPNYNDIQNMKYMDMVVSETLRKWPPGFIADRQCNRAYQLPPSNSNGKSYQMEAESGIWIPVFSIHRDPKHFNNPEKFDPERFSDENKSAIQPFTYIPFGAGPRNCIGSRFALMEIKSVMFHMLSKFDFVENSKTIKPLRLDKKSFRLDLDGGFWISLKSRC